MKDLFYSTKEKVLFWISGFEPQTDNVTDYTNRLIELAEQFADVAHCVSGKVRSRYIQERGNKYRGMRIFFVYDCVRNTKTVPESATAITQNMSDFWYS